MKFHTIDAEQRLHCVGPWTSSKCFCFSVFFTTSLHISQYLNKDNMWDNSIDKCLFLLGGSKKYEPIHSWARNAMHLIWSYWYSMTTNVTIFEVNPLNKRRIWFESSWEGFWLFWGWSHRTVENILCWKEKKTIFSSCHRLISLRYWDSELRFVLFPKKKLYRSEIRSMIGMSFDYCVDWL